MATVNKIKISLRCDELSNWTAKNPVLNNGELAIVNDAGNQLFKIGNGLSAFNQLPFFNENEVKTTTLSAQDVIAKSVSQGLKAKATPLGFAAGAFLSANANFSQALGYNAETKADDTYAFVWNGDDARALLDYYQSHGPGTFSINPTDGLSGAYIGEQSLAEILSAKQDRIAPEPNNDDYVAFIEGSGNVQRSNVQLSSLETVTANVRSTYYVEFDSPLGYGSLFPVKYKNVDPYDGYWEFYQTYERRVGMFNGTVDLIEVKDQDGLLCCYLKSSPTSPTPIEGDILSAEHLTWSQFEELGHYEFTMLGYPCTMTLKKYYDANSYSRASTDKLFYTKSQTSSAVEIADALSSIDISEQLSGYVRLSSDSTQEISGNLGVSGFVRVGGLTVQGRRFVQTLENLIPLSSQSDTNVGIVYCPLSTDYEKEWKEGHFYQLMKADGEFVYQDITDMNEISVTYDEEALDLRIDSHVGSVQYDEEEQDLRLEVLRF